MSEDEDENEDEDEELFSVLVGEDVKPISLEAKVSLEKKVSEKRRADAASLELRRQSAQAQERVLEDPLAGEPTEMLEPMSLLSFQRPGVQHGVFKNLRLGKYIIDARLDLHKMTVEQARRQLFQFVKDCMANDIRSALITHGKGEGRDTPALLKSYVAYWLPQIDEVLAYHTAQNQHGSYGSTYVLLRKSDKKKQEIRRKIHTDKGNT